MTQDTNKIITAVLAVVIIIAIIPFSAMCFHENLRRYFDSLFATEYPIFLYNWNPLSFSASRYRYAFSAPWLNLQLALLSNRALPKPTRRYKGMTPNAYTPPTILSSPSTTVFSRVLNIVPTMAPSFSTRKAPEWFFGSTM